MLILMVYMRMPESLSIPTHYNLPACASAIAVLTASTALGCTSFPAATIPSLPFNVLPSEKSSGLPFISVQTPPDSSMSSEPDAWSQIFSW